MSSVKAVKLVLKGSEEAYHILDSQSKMCNWLYNHLLEKANQLKSEFMQSGNLEIAKTIYMERGLRNLLPNIKEEHCFLKSVHSSPLKNTALRLSSAIQAHQKAKKGKRKGTSGWPRYRSWKAKWMSLLYDEPNKGYRVVQDTLILSLGMGSDKKRHSLQLHLKDVHYSMAKVFAICAYQRSWSLLCHLPCVSPASRKETDSAHDCS